MEQPPEICGGEDGRQAQLAALSVEGTSSFPPPVPPGALALGPGRPLPDPWLNTSSRSMREATVWATGQVENNP